MVTYTILVCLTNKSHTIFLLFTQAPPAKRQKKDKTSATTEALTLVAPYNNVTNKWDPKRRETSAGKSDRVRYQDSKTIRAMVIAITRGDEKRAANAFTQLLSESVNSHVREDILGQLSQAEDKKNSLHQLIMDSIGDTVAHHTKGRGTRTIVAETLVKNIASACVYKIVKEKLDVKDSDLSKALGIDARQFSTARTTVENMIVDGTGIKALKRKKRKDYVRSLIMPFVYDFLLDDEYTRLDTNQKLIDNVIDPRSGDEVPVHRRVWKHTNKEYQHQLFLKSEHYTYYMRLYGLIGKACSYGLWSAVLNEKHICKGPYTRIMC